MRFAFKRAARVAAVHPLIARLRRDIEHAQRGHYAAGLQAAALVGEVEALERVNADLTRGRDLAVRALTATERRLDKVEAELSSATQELDRRREQVRALELTRQEWIRYDNKLCPGCGLAADEDMDGGTVPAADPTTRQDT